MIPSFSSMKIFGTKKFLKNRSDTRILWNPEGFSHEFYWHCEAKIFQRNLVISPSYAQNLAMHEILGNTEVFPNEIFWYCVTESFQRRNLIPPPPLMNKIFRHLKFSDTPKYSATNFFGSVRQKFWTKAVIPLFCIEYKKSVVELMFVENFRKLDFKQ